MGLRARIIGAQKVPIRGRMIHFRQMREFVQHDIVMQIHRQQHQPPVERNRAAGRTRAPPRPLIPHTHPPHAQPVDLREFVDAGRQYLSSKSAQQLMKDAFPTLARRVPELHRAVLCGMHEKGPCRGEIQRHRKFATQAAEPGDSREMRGQRHRRRGLLQLFLEPVPLAPRKIERVTQTGARRNLQYGLVLCTQTQANAPHPPRTPDFTGNQQRAAGGFDGNHLE